MHLNSVPQSILLVCDKCGKYHLNGYCRKWLFHETWPFSDRECKLPNFTNVIGTDLQSRILFRTEGINFEKGNQEISQVLKWLQREFLCSPVC